MDALNIPDVLITAATKLKQALNKQTVEKRLIFGGVLGGLVIYRWIKKFILRKYYKSPPIYTYNFPIVGSLFMFYYIQNNFVAIFCQNMVILLDTVLSILNFTN